MSDEAETNDVPAGSPIALMTDWGSSTPGAVGRRAGAVKSVPLRLRP
jgi:hypothetical protein